MGEDVIRRIGQHPVGTAGPHLTSGNIRKRLDRVKHMPNVLERHAAVISAENVGGANLERGVHALVLPRWNEHMIDVVIARFARLGSHGVYEPSYIVVSQWCR